MTNDTCYDCGKREPCDDDCPNYVDDAMPAVGGEALRHALTSWFNDLPADFLRDPKKCNAEFAALMRCIPAAPLRRSADSYVKAVMAKRYGPPSSWAGKNPEGWHLERDCTPTDASMHDNGCVDAIRAIRAFSASPPEQPAVPEAGTDGWCNCLPWPDKCPYCGGQPPEQPAPKGEPCL